MRSFFRVVALVGFIIVARAAYAREVLKVGDDINVDVHGFYKANVSGILLPQGFVDQSLAMQRLTSDIRSPWPPTPVLPENAVISTNLLRIGGTADWSHRLKLDVAWQMALFVSSAGQLLPGLSATSFVSSANAVAAKRRLIPLGQTIVDRAGMRLEHEIDRLALSVSLPFGTLIVGRQILSWGTGRLWNPTDVLSPFAPTTVDREVRRGFDAVRLAVALGATTQLDVIYLPQEKLADNGGVLRFRTNVLEWDASISAGKYANDLVVGADVSGDVGPLGFHAEGASTFEFQNAPSSLALEHRFFRGVAGFDWRPAEKLTFVAEYHFNGFGAESRNQLAERLVSERVVRGEVFGGGRHYAGVIAGYQHSEVFGLSATAILNLIDPSALLVPSLEYWLEQSVLIRAGAAIPLGQSVDPRAFQQLTVDDVLTQSARFIDARKTLGLRSEFGASPWTVFVQAALYIP